MQRGFHRGRRLPQQAQQAAAWAAAEQHGLHQGGWPAGLSAAALSSRNALKRASQIWAVGLEPGQRSASCLAPTDRPDHPRRDDASVAPGSAGSKTNHPTSVHLSNRLNPPARPTIVLRKLRRGYPPHARRVNSAGGCGDAREPKVKGASIALGGRRLSR